MRSEQQLNRVLVVDDDASVLAPVARVLDRDYEVHCASSPPEALTVAAAHPPDLALLDVRMPVMDGFRIAPSFGGRARGPRCDLHDR